MKDEVNIKTLAGGLDLNGPFLTTRNGDKYWFSDGILYSENEFNAIQLDKQLRSELADKNKNNPKVKV
ncbi:MAG: hypothetical protein Q8T08_24315 [Ignavibacteria bacterium]|jgi:hypothetical protein|nr:hypothetical protein [Ignavibacteria bacterium]